MPENVTKNEGGHFHTVKELRQLLRGRGCKYIRIPIAKSTAQKEEMLLLVTSGPVLEMIKNQDPDRAMFGARRIVEGTTEGGTAFRRVYVWIYPS